MQTVQIDLGGLELESKASGLRLQLSSQANFAPSIEDDIDSLRERLTLYELTTRSIDSPWIAHGADFRLELSLRTEDLTYQDDQQDFIETMTTRLRTGKLWQQLGLIPTSVEISIPRRNAHLITVYLAHDETGHKSSVRATHKLAEISTLHRARLPEGVLTAILDCVCLDIRIERSINCKRRRVRRRRSEPDVLEHSIKGWLEPSNSFDTLQNVQSSPSKEQASDLDAVGASTCSMLASNLDFYCEDEEMPDDAVCMLLDPERHNRLNSNHRFLGAPSLLKRDSSTTDFDIDDTLSNISTIVNLVDAAVRMAVSDCRRDLGKDIKLTATNSIQHLSHVAPALWSPGYLPAVVSRAMFLPTVSHALQSVCQHVISSNLKTKARCLSGNSVDSVTESQDETELRRHLKSFQSSLWQTLRRGVCDSGEAKRLPSLSNIANVTTSVMETADEILDLNQGDLCNESFRDEDGEFLLDEPFANHTYECTEKMSEGDMLSICESLDSLAIMNSDIDELTEFQSQDDCWDIQEMLRI